MSRLLVVCSLLLLGHTTTSWAQSAPTALATANGGPVAAAPAASPASIEAYVRQASRGGEMDFEKLLASKKQTMFLHDGNMYNRHQYALVLWGMRAKTLGVETAERACAVYAQASNRPLSAADRQLLVSGFDSGTRE
ncbi:hypothetical protein [Hymenobacter jeollabukensis]|uniref:Uncharacterized protein n=1 Tax=Hymenobacter jeollabukensis TaxID=2025313 RepID=A0A5R8WX33_9BACT|nr:hypothetical protein [Hymenobacter jeollabukensis]TLM96744.1 hypothetical protein FDY95_01745 [Hymenobacter jeollabukensis]